MFISGNIEKVPITLSKMKGKYPSYDNSTGRRVYVDTAPTLEKKPTKFVEAQRKIIRDMQSACDRTESRKPKNLMPCDIERNKSFIRNLQSELTRALTFGKKVINLPSRSDSLDSCESVESFGSDSTVSKEEDEVNIVNNDEHRNPHSLKESVTNENSRKRSSPIHFVGVTKKLKGGYEIGVISRSSKHLSALK